MKTPRHPFRPGVPPADLPHGGPAKAPRWLERLDHTADERVRVTASDQAQLFERAAWAMFDVLTDVPAVEPREELDVRVEADDVEALLVRWLSELNYLHLTGHMLFSRFRVTEVTDRELTARVGGEHIDPARHVVKTEIKAVTFHALRVAQEAGAWTAEVLFDL
jgi:SHS2 domain-containing protein